MIILVVCVGRDQYGHMILEAVAGLFMGFETMPSLQVRTLVIHLLIIFGLGETCDAVQEVLKHINAVRVCLINCFSLTFQDQLKFFLGKVMSQPFFFYISYLSIELTE